MANLNKVLLIGRMAADPELRRTQNDLPVASFSIGVNRPGKDNGVDFIDIVTWRKQAEFVAKYFKKGSPVFVSGSLQVRTWKDKAGNNRRSVEVVTDNVQFVENRSKDNSSSSTFAPSSPDYEEVSENDELPY